MKLSKMTAVAAAMVMAAAPAIAAELKFADCVEKLRFRA